MRLAGMLVEHGVDLLDVPSRRNHLAQKIKTGPAYQAHFAEAVKKAHAPPLLPGASDTSQVSTLHLCIATATPTNHPFETDHVYETRYINVYTVVPTARPPALCHLHTASNMRPH